MNSDDVKDLAIQKNHVNYILQNKTKQSAFKYL